MELNNNDFATLSNINIAAKENSPQVLPRPETTQRERLAEAIELGDEDIQRAEIVRRITGMVPTVVLKRLLELQASLDMLKQDSSSALYWNPNTEEAYTVAELVSMSAAGIKMSNLVRQYVPEIVQNLEFIRNSPAKTLSKVEFNQKLINLLDAADLKSSTTVHLNYYFPNREMVASDTGGTLGTPGIGIFVEGEFTNSKGEKLPLVFFPQYVEKGADQEFLRNASAMALANQSYLPAARLCYKIANETKSNNGSLEGQIVRFVNSRNVHLRTKDAWGNTEEGLMDMRSALKVYFNTKPKYPFKMNWDTWLTDIQNAEESVGGKFLPINTQATSSFLYVDAPKKQSQTFMSDVVNQTNILRLLKNGHKMPSGWKVVPIKPKTEISDRVTKIPDVLVNAVTDLNKTRNYGPQSQFLALVAKAFFRQFFLNISENNFMTTKNSKSLLGTKIYKGALNDIIVKMVSENARVAYSDNNYFVEEHAIRGETFKFWVSVDGEKMEACITREFAKVVMEFLTTQWNESKDKELDGVITDYLCKEFVSCGFDVEGLLGDRIIHWAGMISGTAGTSFFNNAKSIHFLSRIQQDRVLDIKLNTMELLMLYLKNLPRKRENVVELDGRIPLEFTKEQYLRLLIKLENEKLILINQTTKTVHERSEVRILTAGLIWQPPKIRFNFTNRFKEVMEQTGLSWKLEKVIEIESLKKVENTVYSIDYLGCSVVNIAVFGMKGFFPLLELERLVKSAVNQKGDVNTYGKVPQAAKIEEKIFYNYARLSGMLSLYLLGGWFFTEIGEFLLARIRQLREALTNLTKGYQVNLTVIYSSAQASGMASVLQDDAEDTFGPAVTSLLNGSVVPTLYDVFKVLTTDVNVDNYVNYIVTNTPGDWMKAIGLGISAKHMKMFPDNVQAMMTDSKVIKLARVLDIPEFSIPKVPEIPTSDIRQKFKPLDLVNEESWAEPETKFSKMAPQRDSKLMRGAEKPKKEENPEMVKAEIARGMKALQLIQSAIKGKKIIMVYSKQQGQVVSKPQALAFHLFLTWLAVRLKLPKAMVIAVSKYRTLLKNWGSNYYSNTSIEEAKKTEDSAVLTSIYQFDNTAKTFILVLNAAPNSKIFRTQQEVDTTTDFYKKMRMYTESKVLEGPEQKDETETESKVIEKKEDIPEKKVSKKSTSGKPEIKKNDVEQGMKPLNQKGLKLNPKPLEIKLPQLSQIEKEQKTRQQQLRDLQKTYGNMTPTQTPKEFWVETWKQDMGKYDETFLLLGPGFLSSAIPVDWGITAGHLGKENLRFIGTNEGRAWYRKKLVQKLKDSAVPLTMSQLVANNLEVLRFRAFGNSKMLYRPIEMELLYNKIVPPKDQSAYPLNLLKTKSIHVIREEKKSKNIVTVTKPETVVEIKEQKELPKKTVAIRKGPRKIAEIAEPSLKTDSQELDQI